VGKAWRRGSMISYSVSFKGRQSKRDELRQLRVLFNDDLNFTFYLRSSHMINSGRLEEKWSWGYVRLQRYEIRKFPVILHDNLQSESHKPHAPPNTVTWLQLLRKQTNIGTSTARTAATSWSMRTRITHSPDLWHQRRLADLTCAWNWRLCRVNPATLIEY
jgi:hypothetical protein